MPEPPALPRLAHPHLHTRTTHRPTRPPQGKTYYEYTCCPDDGYNQGEECGDYNPDADTVAGIIGGVFILFLFLAIICGVLACCYCCPGCPWYQSHVDRAGMRVRWG